MDTLVAWLTIPAASGYFYNDVLAIISATGSLLLFLGSFPESPFRRLRGLAEWYIAPLVFGSFFQISLLISGLGTEAETLGIVIPMTPGLVSALFVLSFLLVGGYWWMRRNGTGNV